MTDQHLDARIEIEMAYLHEWIDAPYKHSFPESSEEWLKRSGFYGATCIIPHPPHERWRSMMGMPPTKVVDRYFDSNGKIISH